MKGVTKKAELASPLHLPQVMKFSVSPPTVRAKAVWGPRRILVAVALVAASLALAPSASAQGRHLRQAPKVRPGVLNGFVKRDKMDNDAPARQLIFRSRNADVIVTSRTAPTCCLRLPALLAQRQAERHPRLRARSGPVSLAGHARRQRSIHRVHINRPRTSTTRCRRSR
jgi:hypothetical protein